MLHFMLEKLIQKKMDGTELICRLHFVYIYRDLKPCLYAWSAPENAD